jgi:divalent metal cation (Fe/Co/Zn/Cd) transporter
MPLAVRWDVKDVIVFGMVLATLLTLVLTGHAAADSIIALIVGTLMRQPFEMSKKSDE